MGRIEEIYYDYSQTKEFASQQTQEMKESYEAFERALKKEVGEEFKKFSPLLDLSGRYAAECECFGFVLGFKYAIALMAECFVGDTK